MNEFNCAQGRRQWQGEDPGLSSSSRRHESQQPVPLLTNGKQFQVLGEILIATPDNLSVRSKSGPLDPGDKHVGYLDPRQPVPVTIVDSSKDLTSYGLGNVDWKERVEGSTYKMEALRRSMCSFDSQENITLHLSILKAPINMSTGDSRQLEVN